MPDDASILDVGPETLERWRALLEWNGPVGAFERPGYDRGSIFVAGGSIGSTTSPPAAARPRRPRAGGAGLS